MANGIEYCKEKFENELFMVPIAGKTNTTRRTNLNTI